MIGLVAGKKCGGQDGVMKFRNSGSGIDVRSFQNITRISGIHHIPSQVPPTSSPSSNTYKSQLLRCLCLPDANIHLVGTADDVSGITGPDNVRQPLHSFGVVHFTTSPFPGVEYANGLIVAGRYKFPSRGRIVEADDR